MKELIKSFDARMLFGFGVLMVLTVLALLIGLGKVEQATSYGLEIVLGSLATLAGGFAQWAFSTTKKNGEPPKV